MKNIKQLIMLLLKILSATYFIALGFNLQSESHQLKVMKENFAAIGLPLFDLQIDVYAHAQIATGMAFLFNL